MADPNQYQLKRIEYEIYIAQYYTKRLYCAECTNIALISSFKRASKVTKTDGQTAKLGR